MRAIKKGATDQSTVVRILDSTTFLPETGVVAATAGLALSYRREGGLVVALTESDLAAADSAHADGGLIHLGSGYYRVDLPDAAVATGANGVAVFGDVTGMVVIGSYHHLVDYDPQSAADLGVTALTGHTPQTGDSFARIGAAGAGLTAVRLSATGLDSVVIEAGLNARQALSIATAAAGGVLAGAAGTSITIAAAGVPATNRITATVTADGNRTAVTLSPPA